MKILHMASLTRASANLGVVQQMEWEQLAARDAGLDWEVELWTTEVAQPGSVLRQVPEGMKGFVGRRYHFHRRLLAAAREYDRIVIRHAPLDPFSLFVPERIRYKTWYVFHTKTGNYLAARGRRFGKAFAWLDTQLTRRAIGESAGIIGVTDELVEYERHRLNQRFAKTTVYPNGIFLADWEASIEDRREGPLKIIFVASHFFEWNGLEKLLTSIANTKTSDRWELHLVGQLMPHQAKFIADQDLADSIVVHGVLPKQAITTLMATMDLSLGAFAINMVNLRTACTLKVRESLGAGLPVYAGHSDVGVKDMLGCYTEGPAEWSAILAQAADSRDRAKEDIRRAARPGIDKLALLVELAKTISSPTPKYRISNYKKR